MVISLTKQLNNAQGDLARTIESTANQLKIFKQQLDRLKIALGNLFNIFVGNVLPYINGFLMALVEVINYIAELIKQILGIEDMEYDYSGLSGTSDAVDELIDGMEEANEQAEELKKNLIGIDELNILETEQDSTTFDIDPAILKAFELALTDWDNKMGEVQMKAYAIRDAILDWIGLKPLDDGSWGLKEGANLASKIRDILVDIGNIGFDNILDTVKAIGEALLIMLAIKAILNPWLLIIGGIYHLIEGINELNKENGDILEGMSDIMLGLSLLVGSMALLFKSWKLGVIALILHGMYKIIDAFGNIVRNGIQDWEDTADITMGIGEVLAGFAILTKNWILLAMAGIAIIGSLSLRQLEGLDERLRNNTASFFDYLALTVDLFVYGVLLIAETILKVFTTIFLAAGMVIGNIIFAIIEMWVAAIDLVLAPLRNFIKNTLKIVDMVAGTHYSDNYDVFGNTKYVWEGWKEYNQIWGGAIKSLWTDVTLAGDWRRSMYDAIYTPTGSSSKEIDTNAMSEEELKEYMNKITNDNTQTINLLKDNQETLQAQISTTDNTNAILTDIEDVLSSMSSEERKSLISGYISTGSYADGGYPNKGMFLMNEGTSAEMLGTINGRTAVVNNNEIASALAIALEPMLGQVVSAVDRIASSERETIVNIDSREIAKATQKGNNKIGYNHVGGVFANV